MNKFMLSALAAVLVVGGSLYAYTNNVANLTPYVVDITSNVVAGKDRKTTLNPGQMARQDLLGYLIRGWKVKIYGPNAFIDKSFGSGPYGAKGHALTIVAYPVLESASMMGGVMTSKVPKTYKIYAVEGLNQSPNLLGELPAQ